jgi:sigma-B regulation protein RsbU (phosphoserine phosphatase)
LRKTGRGGDQHQTLYLLRVAHRPALCDLPAQRPAAYDGALRSDFEAELPYGWLPRADLQVLSEFEIKVLIPLAAGERRLGLILVGPRAFQERFSSPDLELLEGLQTRVVLALENTLYLLEREERAGLERELALAGSLQQQLLPRQLPTLARFDLAAGTIPCREIGGDFYDCLQTGPDHVTLAIGDVSGKGVPAALLMANLQATFRAELASGGSPSEIMHRVNRRLCAFESPTRIVSFFCGRLNLEHNRLSYTNAGHLHPMLVRTSGQVERLDRGGLILGILEDVCYEGDEVDLAPGDLVVFFTDGVIERGGPEELFGEKDLMEIAERHRHLSASDLMGRILEALEHRTGTTPDDDTTLMVLKAL